MSPCLVCVHHNAHHCVSVCYRFLTTPSQWRQEGTDCGGSSRQGSIIVKNIHPSKPHLIVDTELPSCYDRPFLRLSILIKGALWILERCEVDNFPRPPCTSASQSDNVSLQPIMYLSLQYEMTTCVGRCFFLFPDIKFVLQL